MTYITSVEKIGIKKGREEERHDIALKMLKKGISVEDIAEITELSISELERFAIEQVKEIQSQQQ